MIKQLEGEIKEKELARTKMLNEKKKIAEGQAVFRSHVESRRK